MATVKSIPRLRKLPSFRGQMMIDVFRGNLRIRKWPRKRGTPKSASQLFWIDWFRQANLLAKYADAASHARAIEITAKSGLYPRDVLLAAMRGRLYQWNSPDGWKWYPVAAIEDISESLDVLAQTVGSVLVRATDRWRAVVGGVIGDVLTNQGPGAPPAWVAGGGGGGITQQVVTGTPISPDNTVSFYDINIELYSLVNIIIADLGFASADRPVLRFSTDGGVSFKATMGDYWYGLVYPSGDSWSKQTAVFGSRLTSTANQNARIDLTNLRAGRVAWTLIASHSSAEAIIRGGFADFDGPITHVRVMGIGAKNMNAGTIRMVGVK